MPLAEYNNMVKAFPPDRTDQPFSIYVLPWRARRRRSITNAHGSNSSNKDFAIGPADQSRVSRSFRLRAQIERVRKLPNARAPTFWASRMIGSTLAVVSILQADRVTLFELSGCLGGHARGADHSRVV
jgi:hypothetical protein